MTSHVSRMGRSIEADEAFFAWTSGDLPRMLAAAELRTNPIDRHFLLMGIVAAAYKDRDQPAYRVICREFGQRHIEEFQWIAPILSQEMGGTLPRVTTFAHFATVLAEDGDFAKAIEVCVAARKFGLHDGTKGDFERRIERLRKKQRLSR